MGNSSSTPSSSTTTTNHGEFDVFISFRGTDTRKSFTSHLYRALDEKNITTFIDTKLVRGEAISDGLWRAIGESKISVVIFSENYAFSKWCLRELTEIMECRKMKKQIVIPVFYEVDPSHVKKQIGSYEAAFAKHENELQQDVVKKWRDALTRASNISGWDSSVARDESELVCNIVRDVWNKLYNISPSCDFKDLVGIDKHIVRVVSLLGVEMQDFRIIGIWGMGGMGKTTIADAVFQLVSHQFENRTYFTVSVRAESENGLIRLRNEILSEVLNIENKNSSSRGIPQRIKEMLKQKKVLIVLDDVDNIEQLETLAGDLDRLGPGSRIIVTTRDKQVLRNCGVKDHNMYEVKGLNNDEALQLFCKHAFKQNHPKKDFEDLSRKLLKIATDLPLAIRVLGSLLYEKSKQYWEDAVDQFQGIKNPTIFDRLKISYNRLDEEEQGLFLDIACFVAHRSDEYGFKFGSDEKDFPPNLSSNRTCFLDHLIDKSLVTVERGCIKMHDLLRDMGRKIVDEESPNKPGDRSRLWRREDVLRTLKHNDGNYAVQGICLDTFGLSDVHLISQALKKMYNLRTLIIKHRLFQQASFCHLSDELRYLHWKVCPLEVLPSSFNPVNLVELDLQSSEIKQLWEGKTFPNLKRLDLSYCSNLISIPDLSDIPSAESINLKHCTSLHEIHSSTECLKKLHSLQLLGCQNLRSFPSNIHIEGSEFSLHKCISLTKFPHISGNIKTLKLTGSGVEEVPSTIESLSKLESLDMSKCRKLKRISKSICKLKSLDRLDLSGCCKLESFPDILEGMELKYLDLSGTAIKELPPSIGNLNRLEKLDLSDCKLEIFPDILEGMELKYLDLSETAIKELPPSIGNLNRLEELDLSDCSELEKLLPFSGLCSLKELRLNNSNLTEISEEIGCLSSLETLALEGNVFERLPKSIKQLSKLYYLSLCNCGMLRSLPELPSSLRYLEAMNCKELIQSLPDESEIEIWVDGGRSFIFNFLNCLKLNQKAVSNLYGDSLRKMELMGTEKIISLFGEEREEEDEEEDGIICLPGSEIPEWFSYKNPGSSINIRGLRNDCGRSSYIMGFAVCLVIGFENYYINFYESSLYVSYDFRIETGDGRKKRFFNHSFPVFRTPFSIDTELIIGSEHILLWYSMSPKCYQFFQSLDTQIANHGMSDYVGNSFEFNTGYTYRDWRPYDKLAPVKGCEVKYCGIEPIYVQAHVMNSVSINQDTGDTSGRNDIAEETCEPHPKRICTEANQCSTTHGL